MVIYDDSHRIETLTPAQAYFLACDKKYMWFCAGRGSGKCFSKDTEFLMFDGSIKKVQDLVVGDVLMGYDSKPRKIMSTCTGFDDMYEIKPVNKAISSHTVNSEHVLTLYNSRKHELEDIPLKKYMTYKSGIDRRRMLCRVPIEYPDKETPLDPYIVGAWLGDGSRKNVTLSMSPLDSIVSDYWNDYFSKMPEMKYRAYVAPTCIQHKWSCGFDTHDEFGRRYNPSYKKLKKCLTDDYQKFIHDDYIINSREKRLQLLAGLVDTDGCKSLKGKNSYRITTVFPALRDSLIKLSESLGFFVSVSLKKGKKRDYIKKNGEFGDNQDSWTVLISGENVWQIPVKLPRKKIKKEECLKHATTTSFDVIPKGKDTYYGFTVEGDGRIVLSNGIVTHNTVAGSFWVYKNVVKYPKAAGLVLANTFAQLHGATIPPILSYFRKIGLDFRVNKRPPESWIKRSGLEIADYKGVLTFETGAHIFLRSLDNYEMVRGLTVGYIWIDEIASTTKEAWDVTVGCLRDPNCDERHVRVTGTPDGCGWTWEEFKKKWSSDPLEAAQYDIVFMSSRENPFLPPDFLDGMLSSYDSRKALQEIDGRILADQAALTYHEWRPDYHKKVVAPYDPNKPLILCWDFNSAKEAPLSMVICQKHEYSDGTPFVQVIDEFTMPGGNTPEVCSRIVAKYKDIHKSDVHVYGDTSGTRSTNGTTDYEQIRQRVGAFFKVINHVTRTNMKVKDRIGAVNGMLLNSKGQIRLFVNPECKELCLDFDKVQPGKFDLIDKSNPARTHTSDALGYFIAKEYPVVYKAPIAIKNMNISNINYR